MMSRTDTMSALFHQTIQTCYTFLKMIRWAAKASQRCPPPLWPSMYSSPHSPNRDLDSEEWQWSFPWPPRVTLSNNNGGGCVYGEIYGAAEDVASSSAVCSWLLLSTMCPLFETTGMLGSWWAPSYTLCGWGEQTLTLMMGDIKQTKKHNMTSWLYTIVKVKLKKTLEKHFTPSNTAWCYLWTLCPW